MKLGEGNMALKDLEDSVVLINIQFYKIELVYVLFFLQIMHPTSIHFYKIVIEELPLIPVIILAAVTKGQHPFHCSCPKKISPYSKIGLTNDI